MTVEKTKNACIISVQQNERRYSLMKPIALTISLRDEQLANKIREQAKEENRTCNNMAETILKLYYEKREE